MSQIKICTNCVLPETFPGIKFDSEGICDHCLREKSAIEKSLERKAKYRERFEQLIKTVRDEAPVYDVIIAYSGGKDSSYTLKLLRGLYDLRVLALSFNNHFISSFSWNNIEKIVDALETDHISFRLPWSTAQQLFRKTAVNDIFPTPTLLRASAICTACIGLVKSIVLRTALEMSIPLIAFGWSPGQAPIQSSIMKTNASLTKKNQDALKKSFSSELNFSIERYFIPDSYFDLYRDRFPYNIHPLAFFDYDEDTIKTQLNNMGWELPTDTDTNSTNCLLNALANQCHIDRHGFHPYVWEIAKMVRQGVMTRAEGVEKIYTEQKKEMVEYAKQRLGL